MLVPAGPCQLRVLPQEEAVVIVAHEDWAHDSYLGEGLCVLKDEWHWTMS